MDGRTNYLAKIKKMKVIITLFFLLTLTMVMSQQDTTEIDSDTVYYENTNPEEYFLIKKSMIYSYPQKGTEYDDVIDTIADHIRGGGVLMTNLDVNSRMNALAAERRRCTLLKNGHSDSSKVAINDRIGDSRAENSIYLFCSYFTDSIKHNFVLRKFDQVENCNCSQSAFDEITEIKDITSALESPKLKWMTFTYFQHYSVDDEMDEFIFVEYKMKWRLFARAHTLILEGDDKEIIHIFTE